MNEVDVILEAPDEPEYLDKIAPFAHAILDVLGIDNWQMSLLITNDNGIRVYNKQWRALDEATDVLSFVQDEGDTIPVMPGMMKTAGDIIVSLETVSRNAEDWGSSFDEELRRVIIHGILHLNGMDHPDNDYENGMLKKQEELLAGTGSIMSKDT